MLAAQYVAGAGIEVAVVGPQAPGPGEVRIEVAYVGICGTDQPGPYLAWSHPGRSPGTHQP